MAIERSGLEVPHDLRRTLDEGFVAVRRASGEIADRLCPEDCVVQSMPDASPTKWHLAHTTWFFDTLLLAPRPGYRPFDERFRVLFNSYYNSVGPQHPRPQRGLLTRPTLEEVRRYRAWADEQVREWLATCGQDELERAAPLVELGLNHEQQHQELMLMDVKHLFSCNPLRPAYLSGEMPRSRAAPPLRFVSFGEGLRWIGHAGGGFAYDNEGPRHREFVPSFRLASRLTTNSEYMDFIADGGYTRPELWLSDGWNAVREQRWEAPLYWELGSRRVMTLHGMQPIDLDAPVAHVSYFEADAFARWSGRRLPTEAEWELAATPLPLEGNFAGSGLLEPLSTGEDRDDGPYQLFGDLWEWTSSAYAPYPGYRAAAGAVGEYNGKFMCSQMVLRGGACVTPEGHVRATYRNFFPPVARWAFSGIRLAEDA